MIVSEFIGEVLLVLGNVALIGSVLFGVIVYFLDRRKAREDAVYETYVLLGDSYMEFVRLALETPSLQIWDKQDNLGLSDAELHQKWALFEILISLFERVYVFGDHVGDSSANAKRWRPWESFMRRWCARPDFSEWLPELVQDEDPDFAAYILALQASVAQRPRRQFNRENEASV